MIKILKSNNKNFKEVMDLLNEKLNPLNLSASVGGATKTPAVKPSDGSLYVPVLAIGIGKQNPKTTADEIIASVHILDERVKGVESGTEVVMIKDYDFNHPEITTYQTKIRIDNSECWDEERLLMDIIDIINIITRNR